MWTREMPTGWRDVLALSQYAPSTGLTCGRGTKRAFGVHATAHPPSPISTGRQVQRVTETTEEQSEGASGWGDAGVDPDLPDKESAGYEDEGGDSKAMRLTLMEEVLLLGLKDREVRRGQRKERRGREELPSLLCLVVNMDTHTYTHTHTSMITEPQNLIS